MHVIRVENEIEQNGHWYLKRTYYDSFYNMYNKSLMSPECVFVAQNTRQIGMGIVYILLILLIDTGTYQYCYRYYLMQKYMMWKVVENVKLFYYCWTLASVLKFLIQKQWFIFLVVFYFINIKEIVHP